MKGTPINLSNLSKPTPLIGWREVIALPQLNIPQIKVKIDTGARSSAIHAYQMEHFTQGGQPMIRFWVHPYQRNTEYTVQAEAKLLELPNYAL